MSETYFTAVYKGIETAMSAQVIGMDERVCAMSWSHAIDEKNTAQDKVRELNKQRAELLEALKEMWDAHESNTGGNLRRMVLDAIANAEK